MVWDGDRSLVKVIVSVLILTQYNYGVFFFLTNHLIETHSEGLAPFQGVPLCLRDSNERQSRMLRLVQAETFA